MVCLKCRGTEFRTIKNGTESTLYRCEKCGEYLVSKEVWASVIGTFPPDFMADREQPAWDEVPEREEL